MSTSENLNQTTWGRVPIYNGTNYAEFEIAIKNVLEVANVWLIVTGDEKKPVKDKSDKSITDLDISSWHSRNERAMMIIVGSDDFNQRSDDFRKALAS
ncbi:hypothetical protein K3495_g4579 [Podosphaera aphanis]|nr:hypothetical protein K3495_g4579 [Podosphaera aphanis]